MFGEFVSLHKVFYVIFSVSVFFIVHDFQYKLYFCLIYHVYVETVKNVNWIPSSSLVICKILNVTVTFEIIGRYCVFNRQMVIVNKYYEEISEIKIK